MLERKIRSFWAEVRVSAMGVSVRSVYQLSDSTCLLPFGQLKKARCGWPLPSQPAGSVLRSSQILPHVLRPVRILKQPLELVSRELAYSLESR